MAIATVAAHVAINDGTIQGDGFSRVETSSWCPAEGPPMTDRMAGSSLSQVGISLADISIEACCVMCSRAQSGGKRSFRAIL